ncbi:MAG: hypothetical protein ACRD3O_23345, partial [Terriglobia bacterium]
MSTLEGANDYLEQEYLRLWIARFTAEPAKAANAHHPSDSLCFRSLAENFNKPVRDDLSLAVLELPHR